VHHRQRNKEAAAEEGTIHDDVIGESDKEGQEAAHKRHQEDDHQAAHFVTNQVRAVEALCAAGRISSRGSTTDSCRGGCPWCCWNLLWLIRGFMNNLDKGRGDCVIRVTGVRNEAKQAARSLVDWSSPIQLAEERRRARKGAETSTDTLIWRHLWRLMH
jgi:hypothetical protein